MKTTSINSSKSSLIRRIATLACAVTLTLSLSSCQGVSPQLIMAGINTASSLIGTVSQNRTARRSQEDNGALIREQIALLRSQREAQELQNAQVRTVVLASASDESDN